MTDFVNISDDKKLQETGSGLALRHVSGDERQKGGHLIFHLSAPVPASVDTKVSEVFTVQIHHMSHSFEYEKSSCVGS